MYFDDNGYVGHDCCFIDAPYMLTKGEKLLLCSACKPKQKSCFKVTIIQQSCSVNMILFWHSIDKVVYFTANLLFYMWCIDLLMAKNILT